MAARSKLGSALGNRDEQAGAAAERRMRMRSATSDLRVGGLAGRKRQKPERDGFNILSTRDDWWESRRVLRNLTAFSDPFFLF